MPLLTISFRCDLFNKAYVHISDNIDKVYKELTKGKASPMGGVAYLSLEDSEVSASVFIYVETDHLPRNHITAASSTTPCHP